MGLYSGPGHFSPGYGESNMNQAFNDATLVESPIMEQNNSSGEAGPPSVTAGFNRANSVQQNGTEAHYKFRLEDLETSMMSVRKMQEEMLTAQRLEAERQEKRRCLWPLGR